LCDAETIELRVNGDTAVEAVPTWLAWGSLALGLALTAGAVLWFVRSRRA
jgi:hypothetical protein